MPTYAVDSAQQQLRATGVVEPVKVWAEDPITHRRTPTDNQDTTEDGCLLWDVEVQYLSESYGRMSTVVSRVRVPSSTFPAVEPFSITHFEGLSVNVRSSRNGGLTESWEATGLTGEAA